MVLTHLSFIFYLQLRASSWCDTLYLTYSNAENEGEHAGRQRGWYLRHCTWVKDGLCQGDDGADVESVDQAWLSADDILKTRHSHARRVG
jgi:hypothetical protein